MNPRRDSWIFYEKLNKILFSLVHEFVQNKDSLNTPVFYLEMIFLSSYCNSLKI